MIASSESGIAVPDRPTVRGESPTQGSDSISKQKGPANARPQFPETPKARQRRASLRRNYRKTTENQLIPFALQFALRTRGRNVLRSRNVALTADTTLLASSGDLYALRPFLPSRRHVQLFSSEASGK